MHLDIRMGINWRDSQALQSKQHLLCGATTDGVEQLGDTGEGAGPIPSHKVSSDKRRRLNGDPFCSWTGHPGGGARRSKSRPTIARGGAFIGGDNGAFKDR